MASSAVMGLISMTMRVVKAFRPKPAVYDKSKVERILVITTTAIGDTLLSTPALRALDEFYPRAQITALVGASAYPVLKHNPRVVEMVRHPGRVDLAYLFKLPALLGSLRRARFDLAVVLHGNDPDSVPLAFLSGAPFILGMVKTAFPNFLTWYRLPAVGEHIIWSKLNALSALGVERLETDAQHMEMTITAKEDDEAARILHERGLRGDVAAIHPFGSKPTRSWDIKKAAELADRLVDELGLAIVILGGPKEAEASRRIAELMNNDALFTAGAVELRLSAAIIKKSSVVVSTDSGPMHIAEAFDIPLVAILGSTLATATGPLSEESIVLQHLEVCDVPRACKQYKCDHISCMKAVGVEEVIGAVKRVYRVPQ
ncbi:MAG: glycosyltransferase family 9 protein [Proteobacteria bacterium]|nr:glycosyltransferase family 9 protein [Pseudomonadota bacterium]